MANCEDKPCCVHGTEPCDEQWYDRPGAFDTSRPGNEHALCNHEEEGCLLDLEGDDEDEPTITEKLALMRRDLENGAPPEFFIEDLIVMAAVTTGFGNYQVTSALRELTAEPTLPCRRHGEQEIESQGSGSGFAGGTVYWIRLACGCTEMDESGDVRAAY
jgi:hypothetical protein